MSPIEIPVTLPANEAVTFASKLKEMKLENLIECKMTKVSSCGHDKVTMYLLTTSTDSAEEFIEKVNAYTSTKKKK